MALVTRTSYPTTSEPKSQVYWATHEGDGSRLSFMNRSFISFSYGGKWIEDFDLIVVIEGDRMSRNVYADFTNNITESDILDEKFFWSSHFNGNQLSLTLATDGITENNLEEFRSWFSPGIKRELILSEHPNRAIEAYIESAPQYSFLPFEKKTEVKIDNHMYQTSTTLYKGEISLSFTMCEPYWHAKNNLLSYKNADDTVEYDNFLSANGVAQYIFNDPDATKIILEDGIAVNTQIKNGDILFGNKMVLDASTLPNSQIDYATIAANPIAMVGPKFIETTGFNYNAGEPNKINPVNVGYFYYPGTAPSKPTLSFTIVPNINTNGYINIPKNTFTDSSTPYNRITVLYEIDQRMDFLFTTPSIWTGYNQVISILRKMNNKAMADVRRAIKMGVNHFAPREYAINVVCNGSGSLNMNTAVTAMENFLLDSNNNVLSGSFSFDSKTGKAIGNFSYRNTSNQVEILEEDVGDMVRSDYLIIKGKDIFNSEGNVHKAVSVKHSHAIYHNVDGIPINSDNQNPRLTNLLITYQIMYY